VLVTNIGLIHALDAQKSLTDELRTLQQIAADSDIFSQTYVEDTTCTQAPPNTEKGRQNHHPDWKQRLANADPRLDDPFPVEAIQ